MNSNDSSSFTLKNKIHCIDQILSYIIKIHCYYAISSMLMPLNLIPPLQSAQKKAPFIFGFYSLQLSSHQRKQSFTDYIRHIYLFKYIYQHHLYVKLSIYQTNSSFGVYHQNSAYLGNFFNDPAFGTFFNLSSFHKSQCHLCVFIL